MSAIHIPSTPAGLNFATWLEAFNSKSETALRAYFEQKFHKSDDNDDIDNRVADEVSFSTRTGGFDIQQNFNLEPTKISVLLQHRNDRDKYHKVKVELDPEEPYLVRRFTIELEGLGFKGEDGDEAMPQTNQDKRVG
jgi:hypothetical protein